MNITKLLPATIIVDDEEHIFCDQLCDNFIDDKIQDYYYCHRYSCLLETTDDDTLRCEQCIQDFGV